MKLLMHDYETKIDATDIINNFALARPFAMHEHCSGRAMIEVRGCVNGKIYRIFPI